MKHLALASMSLLIFAGGCGKKEAKAVKDAVVKVAKVKQEKLRETIEMTAEAVAINKFTLKAAVEGPIGYCPWREGDNVKAGEKLIEINRPWYQHEFEVAKADLAVKEAILADLRFGPRPEEIQAARESVENYENCTKYSKIDLDRINALAEKEVLSRQVRDKAEVEYVRCKTLLESAKNKLAMLEEGTKKTELAVAEANVQKARATLAVKKTELDECVIYAPFDGIITEVFVRPGDFTALRSGARDRLISLMDPKSIVIKAGIPEKSAIFASKGKSVEVRLDAYGGKTFKGVVEQVYPKLNQNSRTRTIEIKLIEQIELLPKMFARVIMETRTVEDALTVPESAVVTTPRGEQVVFVVEDGKAVLRKTKLGLEENERVQLLSGVKPGETVIVEGNLNLKNGAQVKILDDSKKKEDGSQGAGADKAKNTEKAAALQKESGK